MAERAHRSTQAQDERGRRMARADAPKHPAPVDSAPTTEGRAAKKRKAGDPNAGSAYFRRLSALADKADRGETVDSAGMTDEEFLKAFLER